MTKTLHLVHARMLTAGQDRVAAARGEGDEGQGTLEYTGVAAIVGIIIAAIARSDVGGTLSAALTATVEKITAGN